MNPVSTRVSLELLAAVHTTIRTVRSSSHPHPIHDITPEHWGYGIWDQCEDHYAHGMIPIYYKATTIRRIACSTAVPIHTCIACCRATSSNAAGVVTSYPW